MSETKTLQGKKIAVLVDTEYIHDEVAHYEKFFTEHGATVDFLSLLWGSPSKRIIADITDTDEPERRIHIMTVDKDVKDAKAEDYAIILCAANYVACRLREIEPMNSLGSVAELATPPAVRFFADAMKRKNIVKGCLCHALWLLTPVPELLKGRKVICHTVVLADIHNAGAIFAPDTGDKSHVVVDDDLVTGRSAADLKDYTGRCLH